MNAAGFLACSKCRIPLSAAALNQGQFLPCPSCGAQLWTEVYAAIVRPISKGASGEEVVVTGESACFYHENKKAVVVCSACGRFLCSLCDCEVHGQHLCPGCLESGRRKQSIPQLEKVRVLYERQALLLAVLPILITGLLAIYIALRYWNAPRSLVRPNRWMMPTALGLAILQTLGFTALIIWAAVAS